MDPKTARNRLDLGCRTWLNLAMRTTEYTSADEPTVQISIRLPESVLARLDADRGTRSRAAFIVEALYGRAELESSKIIVPTRTSHADVAAISMETPTPPHHHRLERGASGLLKCSECGFVQR